MIVAIDDRRPCVGADVLIRSYAQAFAYLLALEHWSRTQTRTLPITELWLDHDLGSSDTIRPIVDWVEKHHASFDPAMLVVIITDNPVGRAYIKAALGKYFDVADALAGRLRA